MTKWNIWWRTFYCYLFFDCYSLTDFNSEMQQLRVLIWCRSVHFQFKFDLVSYYFKVFIFKVENPNLRTSGSWRRPVCLLIAVLFRNNLMYLLNARDVVDSQFLQGKLQLLVICCSGSVHHLLLSAGWSLQSTTMCYIISIHNSRTKPIKKMKYFTNMYPNSPCHLCGPAPAVWWAFPGSSSTPSSNKTDNQHNIHTN